MDIEFHEVSKRFGDTIALEAVSFRAKSGQITGFVGRNGAGPEPPRSSPSAVARSWTPRA
jgi:ABC-type uncharacterized transport system ATPase subunit